mgnify:CR=1 FL=1
MVRNKSKENKIDMFFKVKFLMKKDGWYDKKLKKNRS